MKIIRIEKEKLVEIITANKVDYTASLKAARSDYLKTAKEQLNHALSTLTAFKSVSIGINAPVDNTAEYDKVLYKLELTTDTVIELSSEEFDRFVNNDWSFVHVLNHLRASYSN